MSRDDREMNRNERGYSDEQLDKMEMGAKTAGVAQYRQEPITLAEVQQYTDTLSRRLWDNPMFVPQTEELRQAKRCLTEFMLWVRADRNR